MTDDVRTALLAARDEATAQVASLLAQFDSIVESGELVATDDEHDSEGHTIAWERQQIVGLLNGARARIAEIDEALERLAAGIHGTCAGCGGAIGDERLAAMPTTQACIACAH